MTQTASANRRRWNLRYAVPVVAVLALAMIAVLTTVSSSPSAQAQTTGTTCYATNDSDGSMVSYANGFETSLGTTGLADVEALAANQDRNELWAYDDATQQLYTFAPGSATPIAGPAFTTGDLDSLTWVNHINGNPGDDQLWGTYRNGGNDAVNAPDELVQINPGTGAVITGPIPITDPTPPTDPAFDEEDDIDGLVWDPTDGTIYGVIGGDTTANSLVILDITTNPVGVTQIPLLLNGGGITDVESLAIGLDGQMYGTTGNDPSTPNNFLEIDKASGEVTILDALEFGDDYEGSACLTAVDPITVTPVTCYTIDEGSGNAGDTQHLVQVDVAADGSITTADLGEIPGTLNIENLAWRNGFGQADSLWAYDSQPGSTAMYNIDFTNGTVVSQVFTTDIGDIDGLTWAFDNDVDASNDELWGIVRNVGQDQIVQIDPSDGTILSTAAIQTPGAGDAVDVDGLAWDPISEQFYAPVGGDTANNDILIIDPATGAISSPGNSGILDIEGVGFDDNGQLFGVTGEDGPTAQSFLFIDAGTGEATVLGGLPTYVDFESLDCAGTAPAENPSIGLAKDLASGPTLRADGDWDFSYSFIIENLGDVPLSNVTLSDEIAAGLVGTTGSVVSGPTPNATGDCSSTVVPPAGTQSLAVGESCTAVWDFVIAKAGNDSLTFDNLATVAGTSPGSTVVTDSSDDGIVPDTNDNGIGDEDGENDPTPATIPAAELGSISNFVFEDTNGNSVQDTGEPGVAGAQVSLFDSAGNQVGATQTTAADGLYLFDGLPADTYTVQFVPPAGRALVLQDQGGDDAADSDPDPGTGITGDIVLPAGGDIVTVDAGVVPVPVPSIGLAKELAGTPTELADGNFEFTYLFVIENLGNVPLTGVTLSDNVAAGLAGTAGSVVDGPTPSATLGTCSATVVDGSQDLGVGDSCVAVWIFVIERAGDAELSFNNLAEVQGTSPQNVVVTDLSDNGVDPDTNDNGVGNEDGENDPTPATLPAETGENPAIGLAKDLVGEPTLRADGNFDFTYSFLIENLGDVELTSVTLTDNVATGLAGTIGSVVSGPTPNAAGDCSTEVANGTQTLGVGDSCTAVWDFVIARSTNAELSFNNQASVVGTSPLDAVVDDISDDGVTPDTDGDNNADELGENDPTPALIPAEPLGSISDLVFADTNGDGIQDDGEVGVVNVTVNLLDAAGNQLDTTTTNGSGNYSFGDLPAGSYIVEFVAPNGTTFSPADQGGDDTDDSDAGTNGRTDVIALTAGEDLETVDAGIVTPDEQAVIGDLVFVDANGNGIQDDGEDPYEGAQIEIRLPDGTLVERIMTGADGTWSATVAPGEYDITITTIDGFTFSPQGEGDDPEDDSNPAEDGQFDRVTVGSGDINNSLDAGLVPLGSIGNRVFEDLNSNGIQDSGDPSIAGATLMLFAANADGSTGALIGSQISDANGGYLFDNLAAGEYILVLTPPSGFQATSQDSTTNDELDSDVNPTTGQTSVITLGIGAADLSVDAGVRAIVVTPDRGPASSPAPVGPGTITNAPPSPVGIFSAPQTTAPLAHTGSSTNLLATFALVLLAVGGTMLTSVRRKNGEDEN